MYSSDRVLVSAGLIRAPQGHSQYGKILMTRRLPKAHLGGSWEFPGGKVELGEDPVNTLHRELKEELGIKIRDPQIYAVGHHCYPTKEVILLVYECSLSEGEPQALEVDGFQWMTPDEICALPLPPADEEVIIKLTQERLLK